MKLLATLMLLIAAPATAQTLEQRADKIITDANQAENAMQRVMAEAQRLKADISAGQLIAGPAPVVVPPVAGFVPDPVVSPSLSGIAAIPSNFDRAKELLPSTVPGTAAPDVVGAFRFTCQPSHLNYDDPIVYPGVIGGSPHLHQWFGNTLGNGKSTYKSLRTTGESTCMGPLNRSAYWQPAVVDQNSKVVPPDYITIYYKRRPATDPYCQTMGKACIGIPRGLRYIFGYDMKRMHEAQPENQIFTWKCVTSDWGQRGPVQKTIGVLGCLAGDRIMVNLNSPECWDGLNLDSANNRSHLAYANWGNNGVYKCPTSHPYVIPQFTIGAAYTMQAGDNLKAWYLSSDRMPGMSAMAGGTTFHADWFGAWDDETLNAWETNCIDKLLNCSDGVLGNGQIMKRPAGFGIEPRQRLPIPSRP